MKVALGMLIIVAGAYLLYAVLSNQSWLMQLASGQPLATEKTAAQATPTTSTNPFQGTPAYGTHSGLK